MEQQATLTVGMVVFRNNFSEVLLTKHKATAKHQTGKYGIPAGRLDSGETETQALLREFNEETNLSTSFEDITKLPFEYSAEIERKGEPARLFHLKVWYCKNYNGEIKDTVENIPEWISVDKLALLDLLPNMERVVLDAIKFLNK